MKSVSKFIINRDDNRFLYVEKYKLSKKSDRTKYLVHSSSKNVIEYSDHTFHSVHSLDEKMSVNAFSKKAADNLLTDLSSKQNKMGYDLLMNVYENTCTDSAINPNMKNIKKSLLKGMEIYNNNFHKFNDIDIPYEENYELTEGARNNFYIRKKVKSISSLISYNKDMDLEEIYNTPVKELVRIKKSA